MTRNRNEFLLDEKNTAEFDCMDCGCHVIAIFPSGVPSTPLQCTTCEWIREFIADPEEAKRLRSRFGDGS